MSTFYDTGFGAWFEAQVHALATGTWAELDIPHLCDDLDGVPAHYLQELEWSLQQVIEACLVWDYVPAQRADWWQGHMNASHSHLMTSLTHNPSFRQVLDRRYPVLYQHAIHGLQPWPLEDLIEHYQTMPDAWREIGYILAHAEEPSTRSIFPEGEELCLRVLALVHRRHPRIDRHPFLGYHSPPIR